MGNSSSHSEDEHSTSHDDDKNKEDSNSNSNAPAWVTATALGIGAIAAVAVAIKKSRNSTSEDPGPSRPRQTTNENNYTRNRQLSGPSPMSEYRSKTIKLQGELLLDEAFEADCDTTQNRSDEARTKFNQAREKFVEAKNLKASPEIDSLNRIVQLKIQGNQFFNKGRELEKMNEGVTSSEVTIQRSQQALIQYGRAKEKFLAGCKLDARFQASVQLTEKAEQRIKEYQFDAHCREAEFDQNDNNHQEDKKITQNRNRHI